MPRLTFPHNWKPRPYQENLWNFLEGGGRFACCVWHRRAGKDLTAINFSSRESAHRVGLYWHLFPTYRQGKRIAWDGMTKDGRRFLDHFPDFSKANRRYVPAEEKRSLWVQNVVGTDMSIYLANGSKYQVVGVEDPDSLVGTSPVGMIFSEYALYDNEDSWKLLRPILVENGGWAIFVFTPRGRNHGHRLFQMAKDNPEWFCEKLGVDDTGVVTEEEIQKLRDEGMPEYEIQQEFYCSWDAPSEGSYFGDLMTRADEEGRITTVPWERNAKVNTFWDLGIRDATAIWFHQYVGGQHRLIDFYYSSDSGLDHYAKMMNSEHRSQYIYGHHIVPPDAEVRELGAGGQSRIQSAAQLGIRMRLAPKTRHADSVDAARRLIPKCWFDKDRCKDGIEGLRQYKRTKTDFVDLNGQPIFSQQPCHDWASHPASAFYTGAIGMPPSGFGDQWPNSWGAQRAEQKKTPAGRRKSSWIV